MQEDEITDEGQEDVIDEEAPKENSGVNEEETTKPQVTSSRFIHKSAAQEMVGATKEVLLPSGFKVTIREQNGEDDDVVSRVANNGDGTAINKFLSNIITKNDSLEHGKYTSENDIKLWKLKDKYYLLLASRLFSLGGEMKFEYTCPQPECQKPTVLEELLQRYDWPLDKEIPKEGDENYEDFIRDFYAPYVVTRYPNGAETHKEFILSSGLPVRYKYLDGIGEKSILDKSKGNISKNDELTARDFSIKKGEKWQKVTNFAMFSARLMQEIRANVKKNDSQFEISSDIHCQHCDNLNTVSLISLPNFFFPDETS